MTLIKSAQLKCLSTVCSKLRISKEDKAFLVQSFSGGRVTSSRDLLNDEAAAMIRHLKTIEPTVAAADKMRKKIISMAHEMGWKAATIEKGGKLTIKVNMKRIDDWCKKCSPLHNSLDKHHYAELPTLVTQFENGPYKHYIEAI